MLETEAMKAWGGTDRPEARSSVDSEETHTTF